jgi:hypothetical protein
MCYSLFHFPKKLKKGQSFIKRRQSDDVTGCYIYRFILWCYSIFLFFKHERTWCYWTSAPRLYFRPAMTHAHRLYFIDCVQQCVIHGSVCIHTHIALQRAHNNSLTHRFLAPSHRPKGGLACCTPLPLAPRWQRQSRSISWRRPQCHQHQAFVLLDRWKIVLRYFFYCTYIAQLNVNKNSTKKKELIWLWIVRSIE